MPRRTAASPPRRLASPPPRLPARPPHHPRLAARRGGFVARPRGALLGHPAARWRRALSAGRRRVGRPHSLPPPACRPAAVAAPPLSVRRRRGAAVLRVTAAGSAAGGDGGRPPQRRLDILLPTAGRSWKEGPALAPAAYHQANKEMISSNKTSEITMHW